MFDWSSSFCDNILFRISLCVCMSFMYFIVSVCFSVCKFYDCTMSLSVDFYDFLTGINELGLQLTINFTDD